MTEWEDSKDFISRKDAIGKLKEWSGGYSYIEIDTLGALVEFEQLPSADVVEVVRCKDCEWWTKQKDSIQGRCDLMQMYPTGEWFCGNAQERRTDD